MIIFDTIDFLSSISCTLYELKFTSNIIAWNLNKSDINAAIVKWNLPDVVEKFILQVLLVRPIMIFLCVLHNNIYHLYLAFYHNIHNIPLCSNYTESLYLYCGGEKGAEGLD